PGSSLLLVHPRPRNRALVVLHHLLHAAKTHEPGVALVNHVVEYQGRLAAVAPGAVILDFVDAVEPQQRFQSVRGRQTVRNQYPGYPARVQGADRKSTRLNSSHVSISYAVFCLKI